MDTKFTRWDCSEDCEVEHMTPEVARDLIIKCFFEAQKEMFARSKKTLFGKEANDDELHKSVEAAVKMAFHEVEGDFEKPNKGSLSQAVQSLARKAAAWGTPEDIIDYHKKQISMILGAVR